MAAEKDKTGRKIGPQSQPLARGDAIFDRRVVKSRMQNHPRRAKNPSSECPQRTRLRDRAIRSANEILLLALDPEMRRIIGDVRENRYKWASWEHDGESFRPSRD